MQEHGLKISELVTLFNLEVLNRGSDYDTALLTITDVNRPGLQFHSFYDYFDPRRLQVLGKAEITYLKGLTTEQRRKCFDDLFLYDIPALVISRGLDCFPECLESARVHERTDLAALFRRRLDLPVLLGNDADCAAVGEYFQGAGRGLRDFVVLTLGTGLGAGIILDGRLRGGESSSEAGHMVLHAGGEPCPCGRRGCWEQYASATALIRRTEAAMAAHPESALCRQKGRPAVHAAGSGRCASPATAGGPPASSGRSWATTPASSVRPCWAG